MGIKNEKRSLNVKNSSRDLSSQKATNAQRIREIWDRSAAFTGGHKRQQTLVPFPVVETDFTELSDGTLLEMIEDPADPTKSRPAVYSNGTVRYTDKVHDGSRILVPLSRTDLLSKHVCLPQGAESYGVLQDLIGDVGSFFTPVSMSSPLRCG